MVGFARTPYSHDEWRAELAGTTARFVGDDFQPAVWQEFAKNVYYQPGDLGNSGDLTALGAFLDKLEAESGPGEVPSGSPPGSSAILGEGNGPPRIYYLATAPRFYETAIRELGASGLAARDRGMRRVVIEKPFGTDLATARR